MKAGSTYFFAHLLLGATAGPRAPVHVSHQLSREGGLRSYRRPPSHLYSAMNSNNGILSSCHALKKNPNEKGCATLYDGVGSVKRHLEFTSRKGSFFSSYLKESFLFPSFRPRLAS